MVISNHAPQSCSAQASSASAVRDPVCQMVVDPVQTPHHTAHGGKTYYFCSAGCRSKFLIDPSGYLRAAQQDLSSQASSLVWTCPMHPEVRRSQPGPCPICGMALELVSPALQEVANPELRDFTQRFWVAGALAIPLLAIGMGGDLMGH